MQCAARRRNGDILGRSDSLRSRHMGPISQGVHASAPAPAPACAQRAKSRVSNGPAKRYPEKRLRGENSNVYQHFCEKWSEDQDLKMTVDSAGNNRDPEPHLGKRTPPADPGAWSHYNFQLGFAPAEQKANCSLSCKDAYSKLASCSSTGCKLKPPKSQPLPSRS